MSHPEGDFSTLLQKELWLQHMGVPLPPYPVPPTQKQIDQEGLRQDADQDYLEAWDAREAEIERRYAIARRDAAGPSVPAVMPDPDSP